MDYTLFSAEALDLIRTALLALIVIILTYIAAKVREIGTNMPGGNINSGDNSGGGTPIVGP